MAEPAALNGLRRAAAADIPALLALQHAAYARNRTLLGVEPMPLLTDYTDIAATHEIWLAEDRGTLEGALILDLRADECLIWSIAVAPAAQGRGIGNRLLAAADKRARALGHHVLRLYTGEPLTGNIAWYRRQGYAVERIEALSDRKLVHMVKSLE